MSQEPFEAPQTKSGRPREFDEAEALTHALEVFWEHGYERAGMRDLLDAMGIGRQSLYNTFGDKHQLYMAALEMYLDQMHASMEELFEAAPSPAAGLREWLEGKVMGLCTTSGPHKGCFGVNTMVELGPHDADVQGVMGVQSARMGALIAGVIAEGQAAGQFKKGETPEALAQLVMVCAAGLLTVSKGPMSSDQIGQSVDLLMKALTSA